LLDSPFAIRCSTARIASRILAQLDAIARAELAAHPRDLLHHAIENAPILPAADRALFGGVALPNNRSNTNRGLVSAGSGIVGVFHDMEFM
jgi:hypothetical protein